MTVIFNHLPVENSEKLVKLVAEHCAVLEEGLKVVDQGGKDGKRGPMNLLAVDTRGRLVVIDVATQPEDQLLVEGLAHVAWLCRNCSQRTDFVTELDADLTLYPKLILVAPDFSTTLQEAVQGSPGMSIDLFRFRLLEVKEEKGLLLESALTSSAKEGIETGPDNLLPPPGEDIVPLAEEEIATFMSMDHRFSL